MTKSRSNSFVMMIAGAVLVVAGGIVGTYVYLIATDDPEAPQTNFETQIELDTPQAVPVTSDTDSDQVDGDTTN